MIFKTFSVFAWYSLNDLVHEFSLFLYIENNEAVYFEVASKRIINFECKDKYTYNIMVETKKMLERIL